MHIEKYIEVEIISLYHIIFYENDIWYFNKIWYLGKEIIRESECHKNISFDTKNDYIDWIFQFIHNFQITLNCIEFLCLISTSLLSLQ